jgi:aminoglycoside phosphotransferase (APT) family kinase protein
VPLNEADARRSLLIACRAVGLPPDDLELIRLGSNAVFRVSSDVIGRVAPDVACIKNAEKQIQVARWLKQIEYPAVRAVEVPQPIKTVDSVVTLWESIAPDTTYAPIADVASLIKQLHKLAEPPELQLPSLRPFNPASEEFQHLDGLSAADREFLCDRIEWAHSEFSRLPFALPAGVIHGDANVGNVLADTRGDPVLIDLDSFATGPREWDLVQTALFYDRLGWHTREEYQTFVEVYGYDLMLWDGYPALADMREIAMTTWLSRKAAESSGAAAEAHKRINAIRTGASRVDWGAY